MNRIDNLSGRAPISQAQDMNADALPLQFFCESPLDGDSEALAEDNHVGLLAVDNPFGSFKAIRQKGLASRTSQ
jgi:hypothetical protein